MTEQNNNYWQGVQTGQSVNAPVNPSAQPQPAAVPTPAVQPYTQPQPANPYTAAPQQVQQQPVAYVQPAQPVQQPMQPGYPQAQPTYVQPPVPAAYPVQQPAKYSGMAIAGMVLGIVAICSLLGDDDFLYFCWFVCTVLSLIFSILGMGKTNPAKPGFERGRGMALTGLILSIVSISLFVVLITFGLLFALSWYGMSDYDTLSSTTQVASFLL